MTTVDRSGTRPLGGWLLLGMLTVPALFCWLLLRAGYSPSLRRTGFVFAAVVTAMGAAGRVA